MKKKLPTKVRMKAIDQGWSIFQRKIVLRAAKFFWGLVYLM
jgi:hypothetical protein